MEDVNGADEEEEEDNMSNDGSHTGGSSHASNGCNDDDSAESAGTTSGESGRSGSSNQTTSDLTDNSTARHNASNRNNERSDSCGSGSGADSPSRGEKHSDQDYGFSTYGPSKKSCINNKKEFKSSKSTTDENYSTGSYDALSRMYGPSKQAHDAKSSKSKSKQQPLHEYDGMLDGLRPI